jgi:hypothetical protein
MDDPTVEARRVHNRLVWLFCLPGILLLGWFFVADGGDGAPESETCAERKVRLAEEQGVPVLYDPRTGKPAGCGRRR